MSPDAPLLQMKNIHASYGPRQALKGVDFDLHQGEIHGLVGEHRAGKSTLIKLLGGIVRKDRGTIFLKGAHVDSLTPQSAKQHKIGILYQEANVIPSLNAVRNIFAGHPLLNWWGGIDYKAMEAKARKLLAGMDVDIRLDVPLEQLSEGKQRMVQLARMLSIEPEILIFDEISNRLTPDEMEKIYAFLSILKQEGKSIIYISHNMDEIFQFADRVTILKNGIRRGTEDVNDLDQAKLLRLTYSDVLSREELESDNRELHLLKTYNEHIIKNIPEGVIILDPENRVYMINYAAISILDITEENVRRQPIEHILPYEMLEQAEEILQAIHMRKEDSWEGVEYANEKILRIHNFPFKDEDSSFLGTIALIEDMSKEHYLDEYLLRTERIASVARLAAGVAHEINNPLEIIQNYVSYLKDTACDDESLTRLNKVETELDRIVGFIKSLLSFSQLKTLPMKPVDLALVLEEAVILTKHKLKEKEILLLWQKEQPEVPVMGDENRLKQVFINLLMNSIEAVMYAGLIELTMDIRQEQGYVEVKVSDDGYGIPKEAIKQIFDPFFSTKAGKKNSGLGLSICQHIIESHQGIISCASDEKTTFSVRLPLI